MIMIKAILLAAVCSIMTTYSVHAETDLKAEDFTQSTVEPKEIPSTPVINPYTQTGFYLGGRIGGLTMTQEIYESSYTAGLYGGYQIASWFALEFDYSHSVIKGDIDLYSIKGDYDSMSYGVFAAFKTKRRVYYKGRIGYVKHVISHNIDESFFTIVDQNDVKNSGLAITSGVGVNLPNSLAIEAEVAMLDNKNGITTTLVLGLKYKF